MDVPIDGGELSRGVTPTEVISPTPQDRVEVLDYRTDRSAHVAVDVWSQEILD